MSELICKKCGESAKALALFAALIDLGCSGNAHLCIDGKMSHDFVSLEEYKELVKHENKD